MNYKGRKNHIHVNLSLVFDTYMTFKNIMYNERKSISGVIEDLIKVYLSQYKLSHPELQTQPPIPTEGPQSQ